MVQVITNALNKNSKLENPFAGGFGSGNGGYSAPSSSYGAPQAPSSSYGAPSSGFGGNGNGKSRSNGNGNGRGNGNGNGLSQYLPPSTSYGTPVGPSR